MKKLLTVLMVFGLLLGSVYAAGSGESPTDYPSNDCTEIVDLSHNYLVEVCGSIPVLNYTMCAQYKGDLTNGLWKPLQDTTELGNYNLALEGHTGKFRFGVSGGNYFEDLTATVEVTCHEFINQCPIVSSGSTAKSSSIPGTIDAGIESVEDEDADATKSPGNPPTVNGNVYTWTKTIPMGLTYGTNIANFRIGWHGAPLAVAGNYKAKVDIAYTVN